MLRLLGSPTALLIIPISLLFSTGCSGSEWQEHDSGLKWRSYGSPRGQQGAKEGDILVLHYRGQADVAGKLVEFFDSSKREEPVTLPFLEGRVIKGFILGLSGMKPGEKRDLVVPPELGYGEQGAGVVIPPNATLHFSLELLEIKAAPSLWPVGDKQYQKHKSGFEYIILEGGKGDPPDDGDFVSVHYSRYDAGEKLFDSSTQMPGPYEFHMGVEKQAPPSWNSVVALLGPGGKARIKVPFHKLSPREFQGLDPNQKNNRFVLYDLELVKIDHAHEHKAALPREKQGHGHSHGHAGHEH